MEERRKDVCFLRFKAKGKDPEGTPLIVKYSVAFRSNEVSASRTGGAVTFHFGSFAEMSFPEELLPEIAAIAFTMMKLDQKKEFLNEVREILRDPDLTPEILIHGVESPEVI